MTATTTPLGLVKRTEPQPGDRIIIGHRVCLVNERRGYDYPEPIAPIPGPAPVLVNGSDVAPIALLVAVVTVCAGLFLYGAHGLGWI
jgi:hypothetical protein